MLKDILILPIIVVVLSGCGINWIGNTPYPNTSTNNQYDLLANYNHYNTHKYINRNLVQQLDNRR